MFVGLKSIETPTSSNSKSPKPSLKRSKRSKRSKKKSQKPSLSKSSQKSRRSSQKLSLSKSSQKSFLSKSFLSKLSKSPKSVTPIWSWALPVLATPWIPTVWLELSPPPVTSTDWSMSPLSASCSTSESPKPSLKSKRSLQSKKKRQKSCLSKSSAMAGVAASIRAAIAASAASIIIFLMYSLLSFFLLGFCLGLDCGGAVKHRWLLVRKLVFIRVSLSFATLPTAIGGRWRLPPPCAGRTALLIAPQGRVGRLL